MTFLSCAEVHHQLAAFHDDQLPVHDRIAVQGHLNVCDRCSSELSQYQAVGAAIRLAAAPPPADEWFGVAPGVVSRMRAEANEAWPARLSRLFDDMHLVWIALASTAATFLCGSIVLGMLHFASPEREDSLAAMIAVVGAPLGSDLNPASLDDLMQVPTVPEDGIVKASLEHWGSQGELNLALAAVVTREGRISGVELLGEDGRNPGQASQLVHEIARGRLEPARSGADPIAVNFVWFVEHMTVKPKQGGLLPLKERG
jgi:anti-sigma factor RsiW